MPPTIVDVAAIAMDANEEEYGGSLIVQKSRIKFDYPESKMEGPPRELSPSPISPFHFTLPTQRLPRVVAENYPSAATDFHHHVFERPTHTPYSDPTNGIERQQSQAGGVPVVTSRCDLGRLTWDIVMFTAIPGCGEL